MIKHNQDGAVNPLLLPLIVACVLLVAALAFGFWAFSGRQDYKNNVDHKIAAAVQTAKAQESTQKDKEFAEAEKYPLATYHGPEAYGSLTIQYPKSWSSYVDASGEGDSPLDGYFHPGTIPSTSTDQNNNFALRVEVLGASYSDTLSNLNGQQGITVAPYALPKLPKVIGVRVTGQIQPNKTGDMIVLPLRTDTLEVWTESQQYKNDFNNNILPHLTFSP